VNWLLRFANDETARGDIARLSQECEWDDGHNYVYYWLRSQKDAETALACAWREYVAEARRWGRASGHGAHVSDFAFTTDDLRGKPRPRVAAYVLRKLETPAETYGNGWHPALGWTLRAWLDWKWNAAACELVYLAVERGYSLAEVTYLVNRQPAAVARYPGPVARYRQVQIWVRRHRKLHPHPGKTCTTAGCANEPSWMKNDAA
jgi:hypothetical protein